MNMRNEKDHQLVLSNLTAVALFAISLLTPQIVSAAGKEPTDPCPKPGTTVYKQGILGDGLTYWDPYSLNALAFKGGIGKNIFSQGVVEAGGTNNESCVEAPDGDYMVRVETPKGPAWVDVNVVTPNENIFGRIFGHR